MLWPKLDNFLLIKWLLIKYIHYDWYNLYSIIYQHAASISSRSHAYSANNRYYAPCGRSSINFNKIIYPYIAQVFVYMWRCMRKDRKICRTDRARWRTERWTNERGEENQFVFIGPLFLFSVLRRFPPLIVPFSAFRLPRSRFAQSSLIRAWLSVGRIFRRRLYRRNSQLLTKSNRLFVLEFFIDKCHHCLNFINCRIN